jgi:hypothetical protein
MLGLGFRTGAGARRRFSPRALFANGEQGAWFDPSDLSTMFQDLAGTVPAALGTPVTRINDKSGRGNHAGQTAAAGRPMLRQDAGGRFYLEFDGVDDRLVTAAFALGTGWDRVSAVRQAGWTNGRRLFAASNLGAGILQQAAASPSLALFDGSAAASNTAAAVGAAAVLFERHDGAASLLAVNNGTAVAGNPGAASASGISIGADAGGTNAAAFHFYGLCAVKAALGAAQLAALRSFYAAKAGVAL